MLNLKLADPGGAEAFANRFTAGGSYHDNVGNPSLSPWQEISQQDGLLVRFEQNVLLVGSWLLALLAIGSLAILVGARMADQMRRVGLLKAVGATPGLAAGVPLAQHLVLALVAATAGLFIGWLAAPLLTGPGSGLLETANAPSLTIFTVVIVVAVALAVAILATRPGAAWSAHEHGPRARRCPPPAQTREPRRERQPAADVVADRRDSGDRDHRGRAHRHSCPPWCSPSGGADPPIRGGVKPSRRYATARASSGRVKEGSLLRPDDGEVIGI
ncbi:MAG TPA: FtsX-like permease family protein [Streptosporangiaceae bacterium]|nr:FtsX-like permease family protein [Streptosporangiaceae bacterium]